MIRPRALCGRQLELRHNTLHSRGWRKHGITPCLLCRNWNMKIACIIAVQLHFEWFCPCALHHLVLDHRVCILSRVQNVFDCTHIEQQCDKNSHLEAIDPCQRVTHPCVAFALLDSVLQVSFSEFRTVPQRSEACQSYKLNVVLRFFDPLRLLPYLSLLRRQVLLNCLLILAADDAPDDRIVGRVHAVESVHDRTVVLHRQMLLRSTRVSEHLLDQQHETMPRTYSILYRKKKYIYTKLYIKLYTNLT